MHLFKYFIVFFMFSGVSSADETYLACVTSKGNVSIAVNKGIVEYTFTSVGKPDFIFKSESKKNIEFIYNHYSRYQADYFDVSFVNHNYKYSIFSNYEGEDEMQGVTVLNKSTGKEFTYKCTNTKIDRLRDLSSLLSCDKDSSLGCQP